MKVTFTFNKLGGIVVTAENCSFDFITKCYHLFTQTADNLTLSEKKTLLITYHQNN